MGDKERHKHSIEKVGPGSQESEDVSLSSPDLSQSTLFYMFTKHIAQGGGSYSEQPVNIILILQLTYFN